MNNSERIRKNIHELTREFYQAKFCNQSFIPGKTKVNYAGRFSMKAS